MLRETFGEYRMMNLLLPVVLLVSIATLTISIIVLRSARRSEYLGEDRHELLRDQHDRLEMMYEERRMLTEQLELESRERRQLTQYLEETDPRLAENLKRRRQARVESEHEVERLDAKLRRLEGELEQERRKRSEVQQRAEQLEQEREEQSRVQQGAERLGRSASN
jgi:SMC interacting uncharacterized protein involved in chromosome segregation